jgi:Uma2 family endonuclease
MTQLHDPGDARTRTEAAMSSQPQPRYTPKEYLALERKAEHRSEYLSGQIYAMTGASREHNRIAVNLTRELSTALRGRPCEVFASDMRVKVSPTGLYTYPDVVVVCGEARFEDREVDTLLNPTLIVEVLSDSTEAYDRGQKFAHYRRLETLSDYVLIAQDRVLVEHFVRDGERWIMREIREPDGWLVLEAIGCEVSLRDIYERVELPDDEQPPTAP